MHHLSIAAMMFFLVGSALHTLAQLDAIARAKKGSRLAIFKDRWVTIVIRAAWSLAIFVLWLQGQLVDVLMTLKLPLPPTLAAVLDLHVGSAIAFGGGYLFDSALGYIPILKTTVPPAIDVPAPTQP